MKVKNLVITALVITMIFAGAFAAVATAGRGMGHGDCKYAGTADCPRAGMKGDCPRGMRGAGPGGMGLRFLETLNLSEDQKTKVTEILNKYKDDIQAKQKSVFEARESMATVMHATDFNEEKVRGASKVMSEAKEEVMVLRAKMMNEVRQILTDAQKADLEQKRAQRLERMKDRFDNKAGCLEAWTDGLDS